mmetsp:Transcript_18868/g.58344  ORF Transcript_18868/g.58344 Transcript_18868/m.58344 type:complete len:297 (+) Transcript_18868:82-972(+)
MYRRAHLEQRGDHRDENGPGRRRARRRGVGVLARATSVARSVTVTVAFLITAHVAVLVAVVVTAVIVVVAVISLGVFVAVFVTTVIATLIALVARAVAITVALILLGGEAAVRIRPGDRDLLAVFAVAAHRAAKILGRRRGRRRRHVHGLHRRRCLLHGAGEVARIVVGLAGKLPDVVVVGPRERYSGSSGNSQRVGAGRRVHGLPINIRRGGAAARRAGHECVLVARARVEHGGLRAQRLRGLKRGSHGIDKPVVVRQSLGQVLVAAQRVDECLRERIALLVGVAAGHRLAVVEA